MRKRELRAVSVFSLPLEVFQDVFPTAKRVNRILVASLTERHLHQLGIVGAVVGEKDRALRWRHGLESLPSLIWTAGPIVVSQAVGAFPDKMQRYAHARPRKRQFQNFGAIWQIFRHQYS